MAYFVTNEVRAIVAGKQTDATYDTQINQEGPYADVDVENDLFAFANVSPPYSGADVTTDIKAAANWRTSARVFFILKALELKKGADEEYQKILERIIMRLKATPTSRTKTVNYTSQYRSSPIKDE